MRTMKTWVALAVGLFVGLGGQFAYATITVASGTAASNNGIVQVNQASGTCTVQNITAGSKICVGPGANDFWQQDSNGNMSTPAPVSVTSLVTPSGAAAVAGTDMVSTIGAGGAATAGAVGGVGGQFSMTAGAGGAASSAQNAGNGGAVTLASGAGGTDNTAVGGGAGGTVNVTAGNGGPGGLGGAMLITSGSGGAANASHASSGGGALTLTAGPGGAAAAGGNGNGGGAISVNGGVGGAAATGQPPGNGSTIAITTGVGGQGIAGQTGGAGGALTIASGSGGAANGGTGGVGGNISIDTGQSIAGAAPTVSIGTTNAGAITIGRSGQTANLAGGVQIGGTVLDFTICAYNAGNLASATAFAETTFTHSATVNTGSKITQDVVGVGGGNFVVKLCTDGTSCAAGNTYLTYTESCTAVAGTRTAAVVGNSGAVPAGSVGTLSVSTACATTDPGANVCIHYTIP